MNTKRKNLNKGINFRFLLVEIRGSFARTTNADPTGDKDVNKIYSQRL